MLNIRIKHSRLKCVLFFIPYHGSYFFCLFFLNILIISLPIFSAFTHASMHLAYLVNFFPYDEGKLKPPEIIGLTLPDKLFAVFACIINTG